MSRYVKWGKAFRKAIHLKLSRGSTPDQLKAAFSRLVDEMQTPEQKLRRLEAENKRLRAALARGKKPKPVVTVASLVKPDP